jgi:hypothetical protein
LGHLAAANHLPVSLLLAQLPPWFITRIVTHDDLTGAARASAPEVERLAALSGLTTTTLLHALSAFRCGPDHGRPPVRATHACRRCAARHGHTEPVPVHLPAHQQIIAARPQSAPIRHRIAAFASANPRLAPDHPDLIEAATYPETISNAADGLTRSP